MTCDSWYITKCNYKAKGTFKIFITKLISVNGFCNITNLQSLWKPLKWLKHCPEKPFCFFNEYLKACQVPWFLALLPLVKILQLLFQTYLSPRALGKSLIKHKNYMEEIQCCTSKLWFKVSANWKKDTFLINWSYQNFVPTNTTEGFHLEVILMEFHLVAWHCM